MSNSVITSSDLQVKYEKLYKFLMNYLWEFQTVQALADLEISIFKRFPDKDEMLNCIRELKLAISSTYDELAEADDEDFKSAFEDLESAIEEFDPETTGCELYQVEEVVDDPTDIAADDDIESPIERRKFRIGDIKKVTKEERELQEEAANTLSNPFENNEGDEE